MRKEQSDAAEMVQVVADALTSATKEIAASVGLAVGEAVKAALAPPPQVEPPPPDPRRAEAEEYARRALLKDPTDDVGWLNGGTSTVPTANMGPPVGEWDPGDTDA